MPTYLTYILFTIRLEHLFQLGANKTEDDVYYLEIICAYEIPYEYSHKFFTRCKVND